MAKLIASGFISVGELIDALQQLPRNTLCTPTGNDNVCLAYDPDTKTAYLDDQNWLEENEILETIEEGL